MITTLTLITVAVVVYGLMNRRGYGMALALGGATPVGAAAVFGAIAVPTFYAVALGAALGTVLRLLQRARWSPGSDVETVPGVRPLVLMVVVGVLVTLIAPMLFDGLEVLSPAGNDVRLVAGVLTKSNIAQIFYLILSVFVVVYLARARWAGPEIVGTAAILVTLLSLWAWAGRYGAPYPSGVFDNSPAFTFQETLPGGLPRVRGIMSEPSGLAASSLITITYAASRMSAVVGWRRWGLGGVVLAAGVLGSISTSATFFVAGAVLAVLALLAAASRFLLRRSSLSRVAAALACVVVVAALWLLPLASNFLGEVINDKVGSSSYDERSGADSFSYDLVLNTLGFGTGLGSNRASSFVASLLSTVGVVGTLLFVASLWILIRETWNVREVRPVLWTLVALMLCKVIAGPDLADSSGILWLSLGVLAHHALRARRNPQFPVQSVMTSPPPVGEMVRRGEGPSPLSSGR